MKIELDRMILQAVFLMMCIAFAYYLQSQLLLNSDVAYLLSVSDLMAHGGKYGVNFLETNPPMILYLYFPVNYLAAVFDINAYQLVKLYIFLLAFLSIFLCDNQLRKILHNESSLEKNIILSAVIIVLLFLPCGEFGQREHIYLILLMPYLFSTVLYTENKKNTYPISILIGCMLGIGVGMKPFFLLPVCFVELYLMWLKRSLFAWLRVEIISFIGVLLGYLGSVLYFHPQYFHEILPHVSTWYFLGMKETWIEIFGRSQVKYALGILCCMLIILKFYSCKPILHIFTLALIGANLSYLVTMTGWYYHVLPAYGLACITLAIFLGQELNKGHVIQFQLIFSSLLLFSVPFYFMYARFEWSYFLSHQSDNLALIHYVKQDKTIQTISCFSANTTSDCFPLVGMTHVQYANQYPMFWWLQGMLKVERGGDFSHYKTYQADKKYFIDKIAEDLKNRKANLVVINERDNLVKLGEDMNMTQYFSTNNQFKQEWQHYRFVKKIGYYDLYKRF